MSITVSQNLANRVLLTGALHCGKSSLVRSLLAVWGGPVCGYSSAKRWNTEKRRTEVWLHNHYTSADCCFAVRPDRGAFAVDLARFDDFIVTALAPEILNQASLLCVDEIGFLERDSQQLLPALLACADSVKPLFVVVQERVFRFYQGILPSPPWLHLKLPSNSSDSVQSTILARLRGSD